jgi:alanine racemase
MTRPARAVIDPSAIIWNLGCVRRAAPGAKVLAVVKADAYGHGLERVAPFVSTVDGLAVASVEEALALRDVARPGQAIVLLEGPFEFSELTAITEAGLETVIHTDEQVAMLKRAACELPVWLKFDSGMHRLGFEPERFAKIVAEVRPYAKPLRLMTHFANAHRRGDPSMLRQLSVFNAMAGAAKEERSLANSGAILSLPQAHADWVRPGLMLYGVSPIADCSASSLGLRPAMTLESRLISVRQVAAGEAVGYGGAFVCPEDMPIGVVAYGYADGYPRHGGTGTPVLVNGTRTQVSGNCSMDMMTVDLRPIPDARFGDRVTLWGDGLPIEEVAQASDTIPYELLCRVRLRARYEIKKS